MITASDSLLTCIRTESHFRQNIQPSKRQTGLSIASFLKVFLFGINQKLGTMCRLKSTIITV